MTNGLIDEQRQLDYLRRLEALYEKDIAHRDEQLLEIRSMITRIKEGEVIVDNEELNHPPHETRPVQVWADIDIGIAKLVELLNLIEGVRTDTSCQGGKTYRPYVMCHWTPQGLENLKGMDLDVEPEGNGSWGYVHPREAA